MQQEYRVIKALSSCELESAVNAAINEQEPGTTGWRLQGGVLCHSHPGAYFWAQAMHRETTLGF